MLINIAGHDVTNKTDMLELKDLKYVHYRNLDACEKNAYFLKNIEFENCFVETLFYMHRDTGLINNIVINNGSNTLLNHSKNRSKKKQEIRYKKNCEMLRDYYGTPSEEAEDYILYQFKDGDISCKKIMTGPHRYADGYVYVNFYK